MPRVTLVYASIGRAPGKKFVKTWQQEPLAMGVLSALTPESWEVRFYDDRIEPVSYETPTDLVAISIETYSAKRGYQIASRFREKGIPVVFGGYHATACPEEALEHGDAVCAGEAEGVWGRILGDAEAGRMRGVYRAPFNSTLAGIRVDRSLFEGRRYLPLALVETGRGCPFRCNFCSISSFYRARYRSRPVDEILAELGKVRHRYVFFVNDNMTGDLETARELCIAVKPLNIRWMTQASLAGLRDRGFVQQMADSGCVAVLIGFESLNEENLSSMSKPVNRVAEYSEALANLRRAGIFVYGTFVFGYPHDTPGLYDRTVAFARRERMFIAAFNHLVPFPGTPLYDQLESGGRMRWKKWWLSDDYYFGQVPFEPEGSTSDDVEYGCLAARKRFYSLSSMLGRSADFQCNCASPGNAFRYFSLNLLMRKEVTGKRGIKLGFPEP
jgi:radical SAM superfamily enzyme YgiQ (UPF0313 family)